MNLLFLKVELIVPVKVGTPPGAPPGAPPDRLSLLICVALPPSFRDPIKVWNI